MLVCASICSAEREDAGAAYYVQQRVDAMHCEPHFCRCLCVRRRGVCLLWAPVNHGMPSTNAAMPQVNQR